MKFSTSGFCHIDPSRSSGVIPQVIFPVCFRNLRRYSTSTFMTKSRRFIRRTRRPLPRLFKRPSAFFYRKLTLLNRLLLKNRAFNSPMHRFFLNHDLTVSSSVTVQYMLYIQLYSAQYRRHQL
jgi:hypothetical protein